MNQINKSSSGRRNLTQTISMDIRQDIIKNHKVGDKLLSESDYVKSYGVSRTTIQRALKELERQGIIERRQGQGSFVKLMKPKIDMYNFKGFSEYARQIGAQAVTKQVSKDVNTMNGDLVMQLKRLRGIQQNNDITQLTLDHSILNLKDFPGLEDFDYENNSLYDVLRNEYNVEPATANLSVHPVMPTEEEAKLLEVSVKNPLLVVSGKVFTYDNVIVEDVRIMYSNRANFKFIVSV